MIENMIHQQMQVGICLLQAADAALNQIITRIKPQMAKSFKCMAFERSSLLNMVIDAPS